jgi:hypothetical protein
MPILVANRTRRALPERNWTISRAEKFVLEPTFPDWAAGSDGRCNTCLQFTRWSFKAQRFSRALIQAQRDLVEMRLGVDR